MKSYAELAPFKLLPDCKRPRPDNVCVMSPIVWLWSFTALINKVVEMAWIGLPNSYAF